MIRFYEDERYEYYDLSEDVSEQNDLAATRPDEAKRLNALLSDELREMNARFPARK